MDRNTGGFSLFAFVVKGKKKDNKKVVDRHRGGNVGQFPPDTQTTADFLHYVFFSALHLGRENAFCLFFFSSFKISISIDCFIQRLLLIIMRHRHSACDYVMENGEKEDGLHTKN